MSVKKATDDVFLSASARDVGMTQVVRHALEEAGLAVFVPEREEISPRAADAIREAIAESGAFVALLTPSHVNSNLLAIEIGGASTWNKPIFLLLDGLTGREIPSYLKRYKAFPATKLSTLVRSVLASCRPLSEPSLEILISMYSGLDVPADWLFRQPDLLDSLTRDFNKVTGEDLSAERVLREILTMRKRGQLQKTRHARSPQV